MTTSPPDQIYIVIDEEKICFEDSGDPNDITCDVDGDGMRKKLRWGATVAGCTLQRIQAILAIGLMAARVPNLSSNPTFGFLGKVGM